MVRIRKPNLLGAPRHPFVASWLLGALAAAAPEARESQGGPEGEAAGGELFFINEVLRKHI